MHIAIDIILVVIMAATVYNATKKGFVVSLFSMLTVWVALAVAWMFCGEVGVYVDNTFIHSHVEEYVAGIIESANAQNGGILSGEELAAQLPDGLSEFAKLLGIDIAESAGELSGMIDGYVEKIAENVSVAVSNIIAFAIIFIVAIIVLKLLCFMLDKFTKLPVLKQMNTFLGVVFGIAEALVLGILLSEVVAALFSAYNVISGDVAFAGVIEKTVIAKFLVSIFSW